MIDFLKKCNFSDNEIKQIEEVNSSANLYNLNCNEFDVIKIIEYLHQIGFNNVLEILMYNIDIFFVGFDEFKNKFEQKDKRIIDIINHEYNETNL